MNNISAEMFFACKECGHSKIDHYAPGEQNEAGEYDQAGNCLIQDCECKHFVKKGTATIVS